MASRPALKILSWKTPSAQRSLAQFFARRAFPSEAERVARKVLQKVRETGDQAVASFTQTFDGATVKPRDFRVQGEEFESAFGNVDATFKRAVRESDRRVVRFCRAGMRKDWRIQTGNGGMLGERFTPIDRVGVYVPGGVAPLVSTSIMTVTLARVAGVREIVACTPCDREGKVNPFILYALRMAGATEVYRVGGIQAIGAMAYGTKRVPRVQKIVGPGNAYVTAAKRLVYGVVDLDLVAGPSEIAVVGDSSACPRHVSMDLLAQLEHGTGDEKALFVTTSGQLASQVASRILDDVRSLSRGKWLMKTISKNLLIVLVSSQRKALEVVNQFAPEHLELIVRQPKTWMKGVRHAGAIFLGPYTPESAGDFGAGPSHVLPTGGTAATFSGLTVDTFRKRTSVVQLSRKDLSEMLPIIEIFGRVEGLDAHVRSAQVRFEGEG